MALADDSDPKCGPLDLEVRRIEKKPVQYEEFCSRHPGDCRLSGPTRILLTPKTKTLLTEVNRSVNAEIIYAPDPEYLGIEDYWCYPDEGYGDCDDIALEKRRRLVLLGIPSASLTMAIAIHAQEYFAHAVLLAETTDGTFVLDNMDDAVRCWDELPYLWERRERPDGLWSRFAPQW